MKHTLGTDSPTSLGTNAEFDSLKARLDALTDGSNIIIGTYKLRVDGSNNLIAEKPDSSTVILVAHP